MTDLMTTRQLQELLHIDRVTIYRMLEDGRLRGFKVGGQWRFRRSEIEGWLRQQRDSRHLVAPEQRPDLPPDPTDKSPLPLACVQAVQDIIAEACEVAVVTLSPDGTPLTGISRSCAFCNLILSSREGRRRCLASWRALTSAPELPAQVQVCHAGLGYLGSRISATGDPLGIILAGQFQLESPSPDGAQAHLRKLAQECGLNAKRLREAAAHLSVPGQAATDRTRRLVKLTADTFAELGRERLHLLSRLQRIAEMTVLD